MLRRRFARFAVAAFAPWMGVASGCGDPPPSAPPTNPSLVLVTIDTLRADHLGLYGYELPTSPNIDQLAAESLVFDSAITTCPSTAPATASILTGVHHATHAVHENGAALPPRVTTLAERLKSAGYATVAVVTNPVIGNEKKGFDQGFDAFVVPEPEGPAVPGTGRVLRRAQTVVKRAAEILDQIDRRPVFLWLHLMDPHGPYSPPEAARAAYSDTLSAKPATRAGEDELPVSTTNYGLNAVPRYQAVPGRTHPADFRSAYDTEIRYADEQIGALRAELQSRGLWDDAVFVLTADHGESLGEHDYYFQHGWFTYDATLRVPLLIRAPNRLAPGRIAASISLVDLSATLMEVLGLGTTDTGEGRSLLPVVRGEEGDRPAFARNSYSNQLTALRLGAKSYIFTPPPNERLQRRDDGWKAHWPTEMREELYDLASDPGETVDLSRDHAEEARVMRERLRAWLKDQQVHAAERSQVAIDPELAAELRALGYLE